MQRIVPYLQLMRLHKPIGIWLLLFPACWGVLLAPGPLRPDLLTVMLLGAVITRAGGCIINDLTDRRLDAQVARTRTRPLASGAVPVAHAYALLVLMAIMALALALTLPRNALLIACCAVPMIAAYPWMKRLTWWPQAFLGLTFNLGVPIGWAATGAMLNEITFLLYGACFWWTLGYDTLYAVEDMNDDARAGIRSSARRVGTSWRLQAFTAESYLIFLGAWLFAAWMAHGLAAPMLIGVGVAAVHALWQVRMAGRLQPGAALAGRLFRSNQWLGLALTLAAVAAHP